jgi:hypothetical protein
MISFLRKALIVSLLCQGKYLSKDDEVNEAHHS